MKLLVIQNSPLAPLGSLGDCISDRAIPIEIFTPFIGEPLPVYAYPYSGLIILGGPMNAEDDDHFPYLQDIIRLVLLFSAERKPILGICLGAQLIARAFGQRVYQNYIAEFGFTPLHPISMAVEDDPLLRAIFRQNSDSIYFAQWHFDTFDLPVQATLLMTGDRCQNQVYRIDENIYGFQCHFEVNQQILQDWLTSSKDYLQQYQPQFSEKLAQQIESYLEQSKIFCHEVCHAWLNLVEFRASATVE